MRTLASIIALLVTLVLATTVTAQQTPTLPYKAYAVKSSDGVTLAVQEWGNPTGREILFIHGFSQASLSWIRQVQSELPKEFRMVTFDLPGARQLRQTDACRKPTSTAFARLLRFGFASWRIASNRSPGELGRGVHGIAWKFPPRLWSRPMPPLPECSTPPSCRT